MKIQITVKQQNENFNKEYAQEYHDGKGSHGHWKDNWSEGIETDMLIDDFEVFKNTEYDCKLESGKTVLLTNATIIRAYKDYKIVFNFIISKSLVQRRQHPPKRDNVKTERFYFYLKPNVDFIQFSKSVYLANDEIPNSMKEQLN